MHALHVLRIRTVSNSDGLYGAYDPSTALSIRTVTIRTDRTDRTNRNTLCSDVIMRCTLRMCSEYGPIATLTVCTERTIRQLLLTVRNSATVLDMTGNDLANDIHLQTAKTVFSHLNNLHSFVEVFFTSFGFIFAACLVRNIWFIFIVENDCLVKVLRRFKLFLVHNCLQQSTKKTVN